MPQARLKSPDEKIVGKQRIENVLSLIDLNDIHRTLLAIGEQSRILSAEVNTQVIRFEVIQSEQSEHLTCSG